MAFFFDAEVFAKPAPDTRLFSNLGAFLLSCRNRTDFSCKFDRFVDSLDSRLLDLYRLRTIILLLLEHWGSGLGGGDGVRAGRREARTINGYRFHWWSVKLGRQDWRQEGDWLLRRWRQPDILVESRRCDCQLLPLQRGGGLLGKDVAGVSQATDGRSDDLVGGYKGLP